MLEALSDFFDVESDWLCGKGENVRWCNELFLPTVADTDCSNVQGKEDSRLQRPFGCRGLRKKTYIIELASGPSTLTLGGVYCAGARLRSMLVSAPQDTEHHPRGHHL